MYDWMRLDPKYISFLKEAVQAELPGSTVCLFGSRTDDNALGGDIDLMILTKEPADKKHFRKIRIDFIKRFGWRKIDLVNFTYDDNSTFRRLIDLNCIQL